MHHRQSLRLPAAEHAKLIPARDRGGEIVAASGRVPEPVIAPRPRAVRDLRHLSGYARA
jgi:hypothetical protein